MMRLWSPARYPVAWRPPSATARPTGSPGWAPALRASDPTSANAEPRRVHAPGADLARDLLVHCAQEMSHLASFLPRLYTELREVF